MFRIASLAALLPFVITPSPVFQISAPTMLRFSISSPDSKWFLRSSLSDISERAILILVWFGSYWRRRNINVDARDERWWKWTLFNHAATTCENWQRKCNSISPRSIKSSSCLTLSPNFSFLFKMHLQRAPTSLDVLPGYPQHPHLLRCNVWC